MTLTTDEWAALVNLLQRTPLTPAEAVWINTLVQRGHNGNQQSQSDPDGSE